MWQPRVGTQGLFKWSQNTGHTLPFEPQWCRQQGKHCEVARVVNCPRGSHATLTRTCSALCSHPPWALFGAQLTFMPATSMRVLTWNWAPTWRTRGTQYRSMLLNWEDMGRYGRRLGVLRVP